MYSLDATRNLEDRLRQIFLALGRGRTAKVIEVSSQTASLGNLWYENMSRITKLINRGLLAPNTLQLTPAGKRLYAVHSGLSHQESEYEWVSKFQPHLA
jgi:hypothetical protein